MNILEIYQKYQNMPKQVEHQLKVAAVASMVCDHFKEKINKRDIVTACLLHDIGNIIKFDIDVSNKLYPRLLTSEQVEYWKGVKKEYVVKYGQDEHLASIVIAREVGVGKRVEELIDGIGFKQGVKSAEGDDWEKKICCYGDSRVSPFGVASLEERLKEGHLRYNDAVSFPEDSPVTKFDNAMKHVEQQVFEHCDIRPEDITEQTVAPLVEELKGFEI